MLIGTGVKYTMTFIVTAILAFSLHSLYSSFTMKKKLDYYRHANSLIAQTFSHADKVNDDYHLKQSQYLRSIRNNGRLTHEQVKYIHKHSKSYTTSGGLF